MRLVTILSLFMALVAASPINAPHDRNSEPAAINKRHGILSTWNSKDAEEFKDAARDTNAITKRHVDEGLWDWPWGPKKEGTGETPGVAEDEKLK